MNREIQETSKTGSFDDRAGTSKLWPMLPIKFGYRVINGGTPKSDVAEYWDGDVPWITPTDLSDRTTKYLTATGRSISAKGLGACGASLVPAGSVVMSCRAPIGSLAVTGLQACSNQGCKAFVSENASVGEYLDYVLTASTEQLQVLGSGTTFLEISSDDIKNFKVPTPPSTEQIHIVQFLDAACGRIDTLIKKQKRLIEFLKEKRQAVISRAVTKGLDPDVQMKDSEVEWLGEVPVSWEVVRGRFLLRDHDDRSSDGDEELLTVSHLTGVTARSEKAASVMQAETYVGYKLVGVGDLIVNTMWAWMGAMGCAKQPGMISPSYNVYRLSARVQPEFLDLLVRTPDFVSVATSRSKGVWSSRLRLYPEAMYDIRFAVPSRAEQTRILEYIETVTGKYARLVQLAEDSIDLALERRTALISAAVTGQIDVTTYDASRTDAASAA